MVEVLVEGDRVYPGVEPADVEEAGGGDDGLVRHQDVGQDAAKVQAGVMGVTDALRVPCDSSALI